MGFITTYQKRDTPYWLNYLYSGQMFCWSYSATLSGNTFTQYIITTSNTGRLFHSLERIFFVSGGATYIEVYKNPTYTSKGVSNNAVNMNRMSSKVSDTKIYTGGTGIGYTFENRIDTIEVNPVGGSISYAGSGSYATGLTERIYKPNSEYLVLILSAEALGCTFSISEYFYESGN